MNKRITPTQTVLNAIKRANGGVDVDPASIAIYEARIVNTRPIRKKGLYHGAVLSRDTLHSMASFLNNSVEGVPFHVMHQRDLLNVGKVFQASVDETNDGHAELSAMFYVPLTEEALVGRLDTSAVDQVSVGMQAAVLKCSACDFDYMKEGDIMNILTMTCKNEHTIGEDGTHLQCSGLEGWYEVSAVDKGGAEGARIVTQAQSRVAKDDFYRLAASNQNHPETFAPLIANLGEFSSEEVPQMNEDAIKALIAAATDPLKTQITGLETQLQEAKATREDEAHAAAIATKDAELAAKDTELTNLREQVTTLTAQLEANFTFLKEQATKAQVAAGNKAPVEAKDSDEAITKIKESGVNLVSLFAADGSDTIETTNKTPVDRADLVAFTGRSN